MKIGIIGVPMDLGQIRRGVDMGPTAMRIAGVDNRLANLGHTVRDFGNIHVPDRSAAKVGDEKVRYLNEVLKMCKVLADHVESTVRRKMFPLVLGGDQSVSIGTFGGLSASTCDRGIIWIDAHADFNTPDSTPSGNIHGMALSAILGYGHPRLSRFRGVTPKAREENTVIVGCRSIDKLEKDLLANSKVTVFTMKEIDKLGMGRVIDEAIQTAKKGVRDVHVSFDIDVLDPREAPGTGTPVPGGITYREAHLVMEEICDAAIATSAELVEVNPILDTSNRSAELAVQLLESLFGKKIFEAT
ncbi:MAG: arginase [Methanomassiliicoccales archaeon]